MKVKILFAFFVLLGLCGFAQQKDALTIAVSKVHKRGYDTTWLRSLHSRLLFVNMYDLPPDAALRELKKCDALLITGGQDIDPRWYHKENELSKCGELDQKRDTLEMSLIRYAMSAKMPLLAICRGQQILNVENGGTLYTDIPADIGRKVIHDAPKGETAQHMVRLKTASRLYQIIGRDSGTVNSFHHQSVDKVAAGFDPAALSGDGVIEAIEARDKSHFAYGVQWHPERLNGDSPFARNIGKAFLDEAARYREKTRKSR